MTSLLKRYKLMFFVRYSHFSQCKTALFAAGAGTYAGGKYSRACFESRRVGQVRPNGAADATIGKAVQVERVEEVKAEMICVGKQAADRAVQKLKSVHPYGEVAVEVVELEDV
jgi:hypothetical protein